MPRSSSYNRHKSSRSYSRDRDYKRRTSSDEDYYEKKKSHRSRSPSSSSRSKVNYKSSRRRSNSFSEDDYRKKKSLKAQRDKKSKKSKRLHRSPSSTSATSEESYKSTKSKQKKTACASTAISEVENEVKQTFDLNLLEGKVTLETLDDIECDKFESKVFTSSNSNKKTSQKVYIDLKKETILVPTVTTNLEPINDSLFHPNFLGDEMEKSEKWVKKLFNFRQRLLQST
ncbi:serine/Arginine-related protein 53 [Condylostylus longicornis]|uniref:serine/Arginine-related protein 53 n=1 Tax=Condylostylus longicornis TaxID=2530218 RepID=UPI00244E4CC6|nr:serine/Arginine-related protein 53 [Condylostylus longicornis]